VIVLLAAGCTTTAAKKALNKPPEKDAYAGFDADAGEASKREAPKPAPVKEDTEPEKAVTTLVQQLQAQEAAYVIVAEEQLKGWGTKQGVDRIIVRQVRLLLKHERVEVRAPALRLTILLGGDDSTGDLIEALADSEHAIRALAFKALKARTHRDFGFDAGGGQVARAQAVNEWRQWWQAEQRKVAVQPPSVYETKPPTEPTVVVPGRKAQE
jgi:hypothetical protein